MILHDLRCPSCGKEKLDQLIRMGVFPSCAACGTTMIWMPTKLATDLYATPRYSDATGKVHSSQREKERYMRDRGFTPAGDAEHGGRGDLRIRGTKFFGGGM